MKCVVLKVIEVVICLGVLWVLFVHQREGRELLCFFFLRLFVYRDFGFFSSLFLYIVFSYSFVIRRALCWSFTVCVALVQCLELADPVRCLCLTKTNKHLPEWMLRGTIKKQAWEKKRNEKENKWIRRNIGEWMNMYRELSGYRKPLLGTRSNARDSGRLTSG